MYQILINIGLNNTNEMFTKYSIFIWQELINLILLTLRKIWH